MQKIQLTALCLLCCVAAMAQNIIKAEYFIDTDRGFGNNRTIDFANPRPDTAYNFTVDLSGISIGYHKLYIRTLSSGNVWGHTTRRTIEVLKGGGYVVKGAEFFFDTDPGFGNATQVLFNPASIDSSFTFKIPLSQIPIGAKRLYIRAKDSTNNNWSITQWQKDSLLVTSSGLDCSWNNPATWSNGIVPDSNTVVILRHKVCVDNIPNAKCKSLTLYKSPAECLVSPGMKLSVIGRPNP